MSLEQKVAIVSGAGPNIGREIAARLADGGFRVVCSDASATSADAAAEYVSEIVPGAVVIPHPCDITDRNAVGKLITEALRTFGRVDALVNNAAVTVPRGILQCSDDDWDKVVSVVLTGTFSLSRAVAQVMVKQGQGGAIVNIASTSGHRGRANAVAYCAAKGGVLNLTRAMACDLAQHSIRVNSVSPTKTGDSVGDLQAGGQRDFSEIPLARLGEPVDQANAVAFLCSNKAAFITGEDLRVDGGSLATWGTRSHATKAP